ncbi:LOW QUALITY PROTEIN: hypothetical protein PHMEG_0009835 [Phytophthora megakarya]|uniref:ZSWIM1/3 RNaseH-like domain-containing protein n=1 Tax=Phytophthora megakarya TaxID=4795 RepID=A0A225WHM3_9STRA|nr:LOW QUALITY PROTEIN: hypothetical protein PHMEG_0009835 [Phytophthora megakarya]
MDVDSESAGVGQSYPSGGNSKEDASSGENAEDESEADASEERASREAVGGSGEDVQIGAVSSVEEASHSLVTVEPPPLCGTPVGMRLFHWLLGAYHAGDTDQGDDVPFKTEYASTAHKNAGDEYRLVPEDVDPYQRVYLYAPMAGRTERREAMEAVPGNTFPHWMPLEIRCTVESFKKKTPGEERSAFKPYPSSRGVDSTVHSARVDGMLSVGGKRSRIYDYLLDLDQNVVQVDVDNFMRAHASSITGGDDNEVTVRELAVFAAKDPENVSSVADTEAGETGVTSLDLAHMRRVYSRFSELLLVDCSHKTNIYNYQQLTFMTMNEFDEGAVVQH